MGPADLSQVLRQVKFSSAAQELLVGLDKSDDAIAYVLNKETVIIQSVDFFTPIVDDPYTFGQIAAANALSDIYAMGGKPLLAMNVVCFPSCLEKEILVEILQGGADKVAEAGAIIAGGHTIKDDEPKYGLSVTGLVKPKHLLTNSGAKVGDQLILTKPLGMGIISTALKAGLADQTITLPATEAMATLNDKAVEPMNRIGANACTDITGFGFLGHLWEMARGSDVAITVKATEVPIFNGVTEFAAMGLVPGGAYSNRDYLADQIKIAAHVPTGLTDIFFDPQTSGGLLIAVPGRKVADFITALAAAGVEQARVIGEVTANGAGINVE